MDERKKLENTYNKSIKKMKSYLKRKNKTLAAFWYNVAIGTKIKIEKLNHFELERNITESEREQLTKILFEQERNITESEREQLTKILMEEYNR